jgi:TRAP-type C4-dicarboxylate transport system substrate-binding protein
VENAAAPWGHLVARGLRAGFAALLLAASCGGACAQTTVMKLATATLNDAQHEWLKRFAVAIEKNTNGRVKAEVYPASQLGSIPRMIESTQLGSIQMWVGPPEFLVGVNPQFELLSAPGLFQNESQMIATIRDPQFAKAFLAAGSNKGLVGASLFFSGPLTFDMRTPVRALADLRGKKVRVLASPFQTEQVARVGGTGVPMTLGEVLPALQQGTLDGALSSVPVFTAMQYYDAAKYMVETNHGYITSTAFLSKRWFEAQPAELQAVVLKTSDQVNDEVIPWSHNFIISQRKVWVEKGGELSALPAADQAELMQKMASVGPDIVQSKPELKPMWDLLTAAVKRAQ